MAVPPLFIPYTLPPPPAFSGDDNYSDQPGDLLGNQSRSMRWPRSRDRRASPRKMRPGAQPPPSPSPARPLFSSRSAPVLLAHSGCAQPHGHSSDLGGWRASVHTRAPRGETYGGTCWMCMLVCIRGKRWRIPVGAPLSGVQSGCVHLFAYQGLDTAATAGLFKRVINR